MEHSLLGLKIIFQFFCSRGEFKGKKNIRSDFYTKVIFILFFVFSVFYKISHMKIY